MILVLLLGSLLQVNARAAHAQMVKPVIVATSPHDPRAFTQGLLLHDGRFFESTGLNGRSSLRRVVPATGSVEQSVDLASTEFGEGLALFGNRLIQLTWRNNLAFSYDLGLNRLGSFTYEGEGWGLCHDGTKLIMSDGSSRLFFRDAETFALLGGVDVVRAGSPVPRLNELECVGGLVYANVWETDTIVRIDAVSGEVLTTIDASGLLSGAEAAAADVLNGIAFDAATRHFFITGKLWPKVFEVRFDFNPFGKDPLPDGGVDARPNDGSDGAMESGAGGLSMDASVGAADGRAGTGGSPASADAADARHTTAPAPSARARAGTDSSSNCGCRLLPGAGSHSIAALWILLVLAHARAGRKSSRFTPMRRPNFVSPPLPR